MGRRRRVEGSALATVSSPTTAPVRSIAHNPRNPRDDYADIGELVESIREVGVLQPIGVVRYELYLSHYPEHEQDIGTCDWVALNGNRRLAAAREVGLDEVPVHVLDRLARTGHLDESVLIENIHRSTLPPLREAHALQILLDRHGSQRALAKRIGVSQGYISQRLSLLRLAAPLQEALAAGELRVEQARALATLSVDKQIAEWKRLWEQADGADHAVISKDQTTDGDYGVISGERSGKRDSTAKTSSTPRIALDTPERIAAALRKHLQPDDLQVLIKLLTNDE